MDEAFTNAEQYLANRVKQYQDWYNNKAVSCKSRYFAIRTASVFGGVLVPVCVNFTIPTDIGHAVSKALATVISLGVAGALALESVYHHKEQWKNYRTMEQFLGHEAIHFQTKTGPYEQVAHKDMFKTLVQRVESAIKDENASTLDVLTLAGAQPAFQQTVISSAQ